MLYCTKLKRKRNYLRVRGEYGMGFHQGQGRDGTTSACAENTTRGAILACECWNYLRVRGEYAWWPSRRGQDMELPPRARRIL